MNFFLVTALTILLLVVTTYAFTLRNKPLRKTDNMLCGHTIDGNGKDGAGGYVIHDHVIYVYKYIHGYGRTEITAYTTHGEQIGILDAICNYPSAQIEKFVVQDIYRRRGIARHMMLILFAVMQYYGFSCLNVYVNPENDEQYGSALDLETTVDVYRKLGFEFDPTRSNGYHDEDTIIIDYPMVMELPFDDVTHP